MKYRFTQTIRYDDLDMDLNLRAAAMVRLCQEAAVRHSDWAGWPAERLQAEGVSWMMYRFAMEIARYPRRGETMAVESWSRGGHGYRAYRDFVLSVVPAASNPVPAGGGEPSGKDEVVARAASEWFFVDTVRGRVKRFPLQLMDDFTVEPERALEVEFADWPEYQGTDADFKLVLTTRRSDFDSNGHVNHHVYLDYLETLLWRRQPPLAPPQAGLRAVRLTFAGAIPPETEQVTGRLRPSSDGVSFLFVYDTGTACYGTAEFQGDIQK